MNELQMITFPDDLNITNKKELNNFYQNKIDAIFADHFGVQMLRIAHPRPSLFFAAVKDSYDSVCVITIRINSKRTKTSKGTVLRFMSEDVAAAAPYADCCPVSIYSLATVAENTEKAEWYKCCRQTAKDKALKQRRKRLFG